MRTKTKLKLSGRPVSYFYSFFGPWKDYPPPDHSAIFQSSDGLYFHERMFGRELRWQSYIAEEWYTCPGCYKEYKVGAECDLGCEQEECES